jgi:hypothetical protein
MPETVNPDVAWALADLSARLPALERRRAYYEGRHRSALPPGKTLSPHLRTLLEDLSDNLCDDVVDEPVDRMTIIGWTGAAGTKAADWWKRVKGDARARENHRNGYMAGDGFAMIQKSKKTGKSQLHVQRPEQMAVRYSVDEPDLIDVAAKVWRDGRRYRMNLYFADDATGGARLERYATKGVGSDGALPQAKAFQLMPAGGDEPGLEVDVDWKNTGRLPVFHFPAGEIGRYGRSVLTDVIPLNDVLNKSVVDLVVAMEDVSLPQRIAIGVQVEIDPATGQEREINRQARPGQMLRIGSKDTRIEQLDGANLTQFLEVQTAYRLEIARKGYLPLHSVSIDAGGNPTATGTQVQEGRQVKRVKTTVDDWTGEYLEMVAYALTLEGQTVTTDQLDMDWAPPETRDEDALVERTARKVESLGLPKVEGLVEVGYDRDDAEKWADEGQAQADAISGGRQSLPGGGLPDVVPPPTTGQVPPVPPVPAPA